MALRDKHKAIKPGYHMNKDHWNTVDVEDKEMTDKLVKELVDHSYELVVAKLPKKIRESIHREAHLSKHSEFRNPARP